MPLQVRKLSDALGAEILGLDLKVELDAETIHTIQNTLHEDLLLVLRNQKIEPLHHMNFCKLFGEIQGQRIGQDIESTEFPGLMFVGNTREDAMLQNGEMWFHSDQCYLEKPNSLTSLHAEIVPANGGNTRFANCQLAYEKLDPAIKDIIKSLKGINFYDYASANEQKKVIEWGPDTKFFAHPLVRIHPHSGRKSLYLNRLMTDQIENFDETNGGILLNQLFDHIEREDFIYEHPWKPYDLAIWDNRCVIHARTDFDSREERLLRRFCVVGETPS